MNGGIISGSLETKSHVTHLFCFFLQMDSFRSSYDNYAYTSRTIQPDEELDRRGYVMYDPYHRNSNNDHHISSLNV